MQRRQAVLSCAPTSLTRRQLIGGFHSSFDTVVLCACRPGPVRPAKIAHDQQSDAHDASMHTVLALVQIGYRTPSSPTI